MGLYYSHQMVLFTSVESISLSAYLPPRFLLCLSVCLSVCRSIDSLSMALKCVRP